MILILVLTVILLEAFLPKEVATAPDRSIARISGCDHTFKTEVQIIDILNLQHVVWIKT